MNGINDKILKIVRTKSEHEVEVEHPLRRQCKYHTIIRESQGYFRIFFIRLFYVIDLIENEEIVIENRPSVEMISHYFRKRLAGQKFREFRGRLM